MSEDQAIETATALRSAVVAIHTALGAIESAMVTLERAVELQRAQPPSSGRYVPIADYAQDMGVHRQTVKKWMREGLVDFYQEGRVIRVRSQPPLRVSM